MSTESVNMPANKKTIQGWARHLLPMTLIALSTFVLQGCQDSVTNESQPITSNSEVSDYEGPDARTTDIQNFRVSLWNPLRAENRCGACHGTDAPTFVRNDDINLAYEAVNPFINRAEPDESILVTKVANGHNCWLASDSACASIITTYIEDWVGTGAIVGREIELEPPNDSTVGESKQFPDDSTLFATYVHPLLDQYCVECHIESATSPQSPYFAESDVDVAYAAVKTSIDLDTPSNSRLVQRLVELHNCWDDCPSNANEMENAITQMASGILPTAVDEDLVVSRALTLPNGIVASGGSRHETDVIALYEFMTGSGNIAYDTSGVDPALHLTLSNNGVSWVKGWGLEFTTGKAQGITSDSSKLSELIKATGEYSIEAWVVPANVTQEGPARIISYSAGANDRNFTLGQTLYNYNFMHRSSTTDANGEPALNTADADEDLQASEQHVVITYDPANGGRSIYVNGIYTGDIDDTEAGNLSDWDDTYALVLGSEPSGEHQWAGKIRLLAVHNRALTQAQITQNFEAGVGEKYFLLFQISDLLSSPLCVAPPDYDPNIDPPPQGYIMLEASLFDNYSYRFRDPRYVCLDGVVNSGSLDLEGMRIGINGKESAMGQAYDRLITTINGADYTPSGIKLSRIGTTIPLEKGEQSDQFFLTFERLGENTHVFTEPAIPTPATPANRDPVSEIGLRTFEEIDASMSALTGVPRTNSSVTTTYETIRQQLPSSEAINGFLSSHQVAVSQLAIEYCSELVDDNTLRASFFPGFNFSANANDIADATWETGVVDPIIDTFLGQNIATQPLPADVRAELLLLLTDTNDLKPYDIDGNSIPDGLPDGLARCGGACTSDRTTVVTKAACASVLGSAALLLQ